MGCHGSWIWGGFLFDLWARQWPWVWFVWTWGGFQGFLARGVMGSWFVDVGHGLWIWDFFFHLIWVFFYLISELCGGRGYRFGFFFHLICELCGGQVWFVWKCDGFQGFPAWVCWVAGLPAWGVNFGFFLCDLWALWVAVVLDLSFFFFFFFVSSAVVVGLIYLNLWCFSSLTAWGELSCLKCENNY